MLQAAEETEGVGVKRLAATMRGGSPAKEGWQAKALHPMGVREHTNIAEEGIIRKEDGHP